MNGETNSMSLLKVQVYYIFNKQEKKLKKEINELLNKKIMNIFQVSADIIKFGMNDYGKPYISQPQGMEYNISHTQGMGVMALSQYPVGVDIELIKDIPKGVLKRCYHLEEQQYVLKREDYREKKIRFYEIWTKKEAYVKWLGTGIDKEFSTFSVLDELICHNFQTVYMNGYIMTLYTDQNYYSVWERG